MSHLPASLPSDITPDFILRAMRQSLIASNLDGLVTYWNAGAEALYGWTAEEALGRDLGDLLTPDIMLLQGKTIFAALRDGAVWSGEFPVKHKDGHIFTVSVSTAPLIDADGAQVGIVGVSVELKEDRQVEDMVARLASTVRSTVDAIIGFSVTGRVVSWNAAAERIYGYRADEIVGQPTSLLLHDDNEREVAELRRNLYAGASVGDYETTLTNRHGQTFDVRISVSPVIDKAGKVIGAVSISRDITEQKRAERRLAESEALHRLILSSISDAVFITDEDGHFTYVCSNVDVIWGYTQAQVADMGHISALLGTTLTDTATLDAARELTNIECPVTTQTGERRWLLVNIKRTDLAGGTRLYTCRDTTERRQMLNSLETELAERRQIEAALRDSERLLRNVLDTIPVGVWVTNATGEILLTNRSAESIWGGVRYGGIDSYDQYVAWFADTNQRIGNDDWSMTRALRAGDVTLNEVIDILTFDGRRKTLLDSAAPILDDAGNIIGAVGINQDVTEQRRAQQSEQEERRFATALSNTISELSRSLNLDRVLETVLENIGQVVPHDAANISLIEGDIARPACWRGYSDAANIYFQNLRYPLTTPWMARMLATGEPDLVNDVTGKPNWPATPSLAWIGSVLSVPIHAHDQIIGFLNLDAASPGFYTQTHLQRLSVFASQAAIAIENARLYTQARRHAVELEERVRERTLALEEALAKEKELGELKSRFVSMVSHEFRTPLASIQTSSDLLQHYFDRMTEERRHEALQKIGFEIKRLTTILENVLAFGRAEAIGMAIAPEVVDIYWLCRQVIDEIELSLGSDHQFILRGNQTNGSIELDIKVMRHALMNLFENAIKYSADGTKVTVEVMFYEDNVVIAIRDRGIGIPDEDRAQLYDAFHRGANVGNAHGTGLGLVIVKQAVDAHHGTIAVDSELGHGTTFTITLPCRQPQAM